MIWFAEHVLERPLDEWQQWAVIHGGELLEDGRPRFRTLVLIIARQNGKTELLVVLSLYWLFVERRALTLGTSTNLSYAKESWEKAVKLAQESEELVGEIERVRRAGGEESLVTVDDCRYRIAASNSKGGRSLTVDRLIMDELREHGNWDAWDAAVPAMNAVPDAQAWGITNQGDDKSVVLESLRSSALGYIETGDGDERLGLFEWSAPDGSDPDDAHALAQANPSAGRRIEWDTLLGQARRVKAAGGMELVGFRTEVMCMKVANLDPAIDATAWGECLDPGDLEGVRSRVAMCVDVSLDGQHATLVAAAMLSDGRVRGEPVAAWDSTSSMRRDLRRIVTRAKPARFGWLPDGPAAAITADLSAKKSGKSGKRDGWPPEGVEVEEIRGEISAVCMGLADLVEARQFVHSADPLLDQHVLNAERKYSGDGWRFTRRGAGQCDASYALAGAVHLARTMPASSPKPMVV